MLWCFPFLQEVPLRWIALLKTVEARGPLVFDVQIVATMQTHGLTKLVTYNGNDFRVFSEIETLEPASLQGTAG